MEHSTASLGPCSVHWCSTVCTYIGPCVSVGPILWYLDLLCEPLMIMDHTKVGPCASIGYNAAVIPAVWTTCTVPLPSPTWGPPSETPPYTVSSEWCTHHLQTAPAPVVIKDINIKDIKVNMLLKWFSSKFSTCILRHIPFKYWHEMGGEVCTNPCMHIDWRKRGQIHIYTCSIWQNIAPMANYTSVHLQVRSYGY